MKKRSNLLLYLLLNILVSAATTLVVLWAWDNAWGSGRKVAPPLAAEVLAQNTLQPAGEQPVRPAEGAGDLPATPVAAPVVLQETAGPTETTLPVDAKLIEVVSVVGAGDLQQEVVLLKRIGEGNLRMVGWKLAGEHDNTFTFPEDPELTLYKDGAVQVVSGPGTDTVTEVYWNRTAAAWRAGELLRLLDPQGNERATFRVP